VHEQWTNIFRNQFKTTNQASAVTSETKSGFRASGKRLKSGSRTGGGDFTGSLAVLASHGIPEGAKRPTSICALENEPNADSAGLCHGV